MGALYYYIFFGLFAFFSVLGMGGSFVGAQESGSYTLASSVVAGVFDDGIHIEVRWTAPEASDRRSDWVGIYRAGAPDTQYLLWRYTGSEASGDLIFALRESGDYEARYFKHNRYERVATAPFVITVNDDSGAYSISAHPQAVARGADVLVTWQTPEMSNNERDWIGMFRRGAPSHKSYSMWKYTGGSSQGSLPFRFAQPGLYEFRYFKNNGYTKVGASAFFEVTEVNINGNNNTNESGVGVYTLSSDKISVEVREPISISWTAPESANRNKDWIGIYRPGATNKEYVIWKYTNGTTQGSVAFTINAAGSYEARYFKNNGLISVGAPYIFTVTAAQNGGGAATSTQYQLMAAPAAIVESDSVRVAWRSPGGKISTALDWVGLYRVDASDRGYIQWKYTNLRDGDTTFVITNPGVYEFRYFKHNGYVRVATSNTVTVMGALDDLNGIINYPPPATGPIVVFGDSLVRGRGALPDQDFVSEIAKRMSDEEIINAGRDGDTTRRALERVETDIVARDPKMVIILLGGNDLLRQRINSIDNATVRDVVRRLLEEMERTQLLEAIPLQETFTNLETIIRRSQDTGALVIVLGIQGGIFGDHYAGEFRSLTQRTGALYVPDVTRGVLGHPALMSDLIHPNDLGYQVMAERVTPVLDALME